MNGEYLKVNSLIEKQYYMLNLGSKYGITYLPIKKQNEIRNKYKDIEIIGAYEFLSKYKEIDELSLE